MRGLFKKVASFFHNRPGIKTTVVGLLGAGASAAAAGAFGMKGQAVAAGAVAVAGLWTKRPKDATLEDKAGIVVGDVVYQTSDAGKQLMTVGEVVEPTPGVIAARCVWFENGAAKAAVFSVADLTEEVK